MSVLVACAQQKVPVQTGDLSSSGSPEETQTTGALNTADPTGVIDSSDETSSDLTDVFAPESSTEPEETEPAQTQPEPQKDTITLAGSEIYTGSLILVNSASPYCYKIASLYSPTELDKLPGNTLNDLGWTSLYAHKTDSYLLRSRLLFLRSEVYTAFNRMMQAFSSRTGHRDVQVRYAFQLVSDAKDAASLADERCTGLTVEVNIFTDEGTFSIDHSAKRADYYEWFAANCHTYGFIMSGESGYFRYVGVPHATYLYRNGLTLEGYLSYLRSFTADKPMSLVDDDGVLWQIFYVPVGDNALVEVEIPAGSTPVISGNNRDGFIIACR